MSHFMGVGTFRIGLNRPDLGFWRLTLIAVSNQKSCVWSINTSTV